jgi:2-polyprenyl-3-methyl-5-hydroxy-6-metoxy-1,4-benzoquinol methylase
MSKSIAKKSSSQNKSGYLHGYSAEEQRRLYQQARFLEETVYQHIDLNDRTKLLEIGCGVGAQTEIILQRFPHLHITCVDAEKTQLKTAERHLSTPIKDGQVELVHGDAGKLPMKDSSFDSVFICWLLEHVPDPKVILSESLRLLTSGGKIFCTEVLNATLYLHPYSPATLQYWFAFNDHQWTLKGDPFVGAKLGGYLHSVGFQDIHTQNLVFHYDSRSPKMRTMMIDYWTRLLLSGAPSLVSAGRVTQKLVSDMEKELKMIKSDPNAVFYYAAIQAEARAY